MTYKPTLFSTIAWVSLGVGAGSTVLAWIYIPANWLFWRLLLAVFLATGAITFGLMTYYRDYKRRKINTLFSGTTLLIAKISAGIGSVEIPTDLHWVLRLALESVFASNVLVNIIFALLAFVMLSYGVMLLYVDKRFTGESKRELPLPVFRSELPVSSTAMSFYFRPKILQPEPKKIFWARVKLLFEHRTSIKFSLVYDSTHECLIGTYETPLSKPDVVIRCDDRGQPVQEEDIEFFWNTCQKVIHKMGSLDGQIRYYVVPDKKLVPEDLRQKHKEIEFRSEDELVDQVIDTSSYLRALVEQFEKTPIYSVVRSDLTLAKIYISPQYGLGTTSSNATNTLLHSTSRFATQTKVPLEEYLDRWLVEDGARHIALLGDYGMGKSSFLIYYAAYLAKKLLSGEKTRIPVLIRLTSSSPRNDPESERLLSKFSADWEFGRSLEPLRILIRNHRIVLLLDAFDEIDLVGDSMMRADHFRELWKLATPGNKIVIAGRPGYFPNDEERKKNLRLIHYENKPNVRESCTRIDLHPFEEEEVRQSFKKYYDSEEEAAQSLDYVLNRPRILELAKRPVMAHIIRETLSELQKRNTQNKDNLREANLLKIYTDAWTAREEAKDRDLLVDEDERGRFMEELASWMLIHNQSQIPAETVIEKFEIWFPKKRGLERRDIREGIATSLLTCSFLIPASPNSYKFAHKPFFEFFIASFLLRCLREKGEVPQLYRTFLWPLEISSHVADLSLFDSMGNPQKMELGRLFDGIAGESPKNQSILSLLWWRSQKRKKTSVDSGMTALSAKATEELSPFEVSRLNGLSVLFLRQDPYFSIAKHCFLSSKAQIFAGRSYSTRCFIALRIPKLELSGANLFNAYLRSANLSNANLCGADLQNADLRKSNLEGAELQNADLSGADLSFAGLQNADLRGANLTGARLARANLYNADLQNSSFANSVLRFTMLSKANLSAANLQKADLQYADLQAAELQKADLKKASLDSSTLARANLHEVDLRNANLQGANLQGANLQGTKLQGANLQGANLQDTKLQYADLRYADLQEAFLQNATLNNANASTSTKWPTSFAPESKGINIID